MGITMNQRTYEVTLFQGDDLDRLAVLSAAAAKLKPRAPNALSTGTEDGQYAAAAEAYAAAAQEHDGFLAEAKTRAVTVEMKPMPRKAYQELQVGHPPRDDDDGDAVIGVNASTFAEPLLMASIVGPVMSDAEKQEFLDSLNNAQFAHLADEALTINRVVFAPKEPLLASKLDPSSGETSASREPSG